MNKDLITAEHNDARETRDEPCLAARKERPRKGEV